MKKLSLIALWLWTFVTFFLLTNCGPTDAEPTIDDEVNNEFLDVDEIDVKHQFGVSPCPQQIDEIDISKHSRKSGGSIDSVSIRNNDARVEAYFAESNGHEHHFGPEVETTCSFEFTCSDDESFESTVDFECFSKGTLVSTESVGVKVVVSR